jgi:uncharacterized protein YndB with AHSA1/START domain
MAPIEFEVAGRLEAEPARVWSRLIDSESVAEWLDDVTSVAADGESAVARLAGEDGRSWVDVRVTDVEPRRHLGIHLNRPSSLLREARVNVELSPDASGTAYRLGVVCRPHLLARLLSPLVRLRAEVALQRAVRGFKALVDADTRERRVSAEGGQDLLGK